MKFLKNVPNTEQRSAFQRVCIIPRLSLHNIHFIRECTESFSKETDPLLCVCACLKENATNTSSVLQVEKKAED